MNSKDYWAKRSALDMVEYMRTADETATLIRETAEQALEVIRNEIKGIFSAFTSFGISEADAKRILSGGGTVLQQMRRAAEKLEDPKQKQALLSAINSAGAYRFRIQRLEEVGKQIAEQCKQLYKAQLEATETALRSVAEDAYYHTMFNLQKETGLAFSFAQFPKKQIDKILAFNWSGAHFSQRIWRNTDILAQAIKDEMLVSLLSGRSNTKTMQAIREQFNVNSFCAWRLVRTESSYVSNAAVSEGYKEADIEKYRFIATLDNRTSEECSALDGKVFKLADKKVGTNFPPMHPFCRSTTIADFGEETLKSLQRRARDKDGKTMKVPADMTYQVWAEQNGINAAKTLDKSSGSGIINTGHGLAERRKFTFDDFPDIHNADSVSNALKYAADRLGVENVRDIEKLTDGETVIRMFREIETLTAKYGKRFSSVTIVDYGENRTIAETVVGELRLNSRFMNNPNAAKALLDDWLDIGYIPKGSNSIEFVARHEYFHLLTQDLIVMPHSRIATEVNRAIKDGCEVISDNGRKDLHEFVADLLSANELTPRQQKLKATILKLLK